MNPFSDLYPEDDGPDLYNPAHGNGNLPFQQMEDSHAHSPAASTIVEFEDDILGGRGHRVDVGRNQVNSPKKKLQSKAKPVGDIRGEADERQLYVLKKCCGCMSPLLLHHILAVTYWIFFLLVLVSTIGQSALKEQSRQMRGFLVSKFIFVLLLVMIVLLVEFRFSKEHSGFRFLIAPIYAFANVELLIFPVITGVHAERLVSLDTFWKALTHSNELIVAAPPGTPSYLHAPPPGVTISHVNAGASAVNPADSAAIAASAISAISAIADTATTHVGGVHLGAAHHGGASANGHKVGSTVKYGDECLAAWLFVLSCTFSVVLVVSQIVVFCIVKYWSPEKYREWELQQIKKEQEKLQKSKETLERIQKEGSRAHSPTQSLDFEENTDGEINQNSSKKTKPKETDPLIGGYDTVSEKNPWEKEHNWEN